MSKMTSVIIAPITKPTIAPTMPPSHTIVRRVSGRGSRHKVGNWQT
jgi:hypothetical protein